MDIQTPHSLIESILEVWKDGIGDDFAGYRGRVYRMFNYCLALHPASEEEKTKLAIAACFHDIGLWSAHTVDYLPPSIEQAERYRAETGRADWFEEIALMIEWHHKVRPYRDRQFPLVEVFRKGDLVDFSLGFFNCGLPKSLVNEVKAAIPDAGFNRFLLKGAKDWFVVKTCPPGRNGWKSACLIGLASYNVRPERPVGYPSPGTIPLSSTPA